MFLNFEDKINSSLTYSDMIEQVLGVIMEQEYSLKVGLRLSEEKG